MRLTSVISEAWRNVVSGTSRTTALSLSIACATLLFGLADTVTVVDILRDGQQFRSAGAAVHILSAPAAINAQACEQLAGHGNIVAAGALRFRAAGIRHLALPDMQPTYAEITAGFPAVISTAPDQHATGIMLSQQLAQALAATEGDDLPTATGRAEVTAVYPYPDDGRLQTLAYAALAPVPATGPFDECWTEIWPYDQSSLRLIHTALRVDTTKDTEITLKQLNSSHGEKFDIAAKLSQRSTKHLPLAAAAVAAALAALAIRLRRLELASARHCGVTVPDQLAQAMAEAVVATAAILSLTVPVFYITSRSLATMPDYLFHQQINAAFAACGATILATGIAVLLVRQKQLFAYFKQR